jgi:hypothetical protein
MLLDGRQHSHPDPIDLYQPGQADESANELAAQWGNQLPHNGHHAVQSNPASNIINHRTKTGKEGHPLQWIPASVKTHPNRPSEARYEIRIADAEIDEYEATCQDLIDSFLLDQPQTSHAETRQYLFQPHWQEDWPATPIEETESAVGWVQVHQEAE